MPVVTVRLQMHDHSMSKDENHDNDHSTNNDPGNNDSGNNDPGKATKWDEVGQQLQSLAMKLKYHAEQARGEEREKVEGAVELVRASIEDAFEALKGVVSDPAIRDDVKNVASGMSHAVSSTFKEIRADVQERIDKRA